MPKTLDISLGIPLYKSSNHLSTLLQSLESQCVFPSEIIFLDDASPDYSRNIVEDFLIKYPNLNIRIYTNEKNLGIAGSYNRITQLSKGKWIQILDADDYFIGNFYELIERHMTDEVVAIVAGMRSNVKTISLINRMFSQFIPVVLPKYLPMLGSFATRSGIVYSARLLKENSFKDPIFDGSDMLHFFDIRKHGKCIYEPMAMIHYNVHSGAYSSQSTENNYLEELKNRRDMPLIYFLDFFLRKKVFSLFRRV